MKPRILVVPFLIVVAMLLLFSPSTWASEKYRIIYSFQGNYGVGGPNGGPPTAAPILDSHGNLYGPASGGTGQSCAGPCGVIYKLTPGPDGKWKESVALNFGSRSDHGWPDSHLSFDSHGNLYGSLSSYWVFQMTPHPNRWDLNLIFQGYGTDVGGVVADRMGNLYGALGDSSDYKVTIGQLASGSGGWSYSDLHTFCATGDCIDGAFPRAPLSWGKDGNLYGTAFWGGFGGCYEQQGCGTAFRMIADGDGTWTYNVIHSFGESKSQDGENPWGGLTEDASGNFYGTTFYGGPSNTGTVFKLTPTGEGEWTETLLYSFPDINVGAYPWGNLVLDRLGNLYGVANGGSACGRYYCGQVFELSPQKDGKWKYRVVHAFQGPDGEYPYGVVIDSEGKLFGTALGGGAYGYGVVFAIRP